MAAPKTFATMSLISLFFVATVSAGPMINFDGTTDGGTLEYDVLNGPLEGMDIIIDFLQVTGVGGGLDINYACQACVLNFVTGNGAETGGGTGIYSFGAGGSIVITGGVAAMGIDPTDGGGADTILLQGTFTSSPANLATAAGTVGGFFAFGHDEKNQEILDFLGIQAVDFNFAATAIQASVAIDGDGTFTGTVTESDVTNTVPLPGTTLLMMLGLGGLAVRRRLN